MGVLTSQIKNVTDSPFALLISSTFCSRSCMSWFNSLLRVRTISIWDFNLSRCSEYTSVNGFKSWPRCVAEKQPHWEQIDVFYKIIKSTILRYLRILEVLGQFMVLRNFWGEGTNLWILIIIYDRINDLFLAVIAINITFLAGMNRAPVKIDITSVKITGLIDIML